MIDPEQINFYRDAMTTIRVELDAENGTVSEPRWAVLMVNTPHNKYVDQTETYVILETNHDSFAEAQHSAFWFAHLQEEHPRDLLER